jgi:predicted MPP superfamily phosphohydrolase
LGRSEEIPVLPRWFSSAVIVALVASLPHRADVTGVVFVDTNGNGVRDAGEPGLAGVAVSNQDTVVTTDRSGAFRFTSRGTGIVFVSTPNDYRAVGPFWRVADGGTALAFPLARRAARTELTFVHASDTHISAASVERTRRLRVLVDSIHPDLLVITGDLVRDALRVGEAEATGYYELFARETGAFRTPVFTVPGNHENFGIERDTSHVSATHPLYGRGMYRHYFGPDYYSFTRGGVHFVGLNTADIDDQHYYGHVDSLQLAWLARDLALVPPSMPVVTFDHIPFFTTFETINGYDDKSVAPTLITVRGKTVFRHSVSNAGDVLAVLRTRRHVLALGGHIHGTERIEYEIDGVKTRFNQVSAVIAPPRGAGLTFVSGVTLYRVKNGVIDAGQFIPLDASR